MFGERLREIRRKNRVKQHELGAVAGVQKSSISFYEIGRSTPSDTVKIKIARYFDISLDYFLGIIDEPVPFYSDDVFLMLPDNATDEEKFLISELMKYIDYRRQRTNNTGDTV